MIRLMAILQIQSADIETPNNHRVLTDQGADLGVLRGVHRGKTTQT
jgi:hypothetical protein